MHYFYESIINNEQKEQKSTCEENYLREILLGSLRMTKNKQKEDSVGKESNGEGKKEIRTHRESAKVKEKHQLLVQIIQGQGLQK